MHSKLIHCKKTGQEELAKGISHQKNLEHFLQSIFVSIKYSSKIFFIPKNLARLFCRKEMPPRFGG